MRKLRKKSILISEQLKNISFIFQKEEEERKEKERYEAELKRKQMLALEMERQREQERVADEKALKEVLKGQMNELRGRELEVKCFIIEQ